jgi:Ca2+-transporting ATPase
VDSLPVALLGVAAVVSLATGGLVEAAAIAAVVGVNAAIGYVTETRAERTLSSLADPGAATARLRRDDRARNVPVDEVVPGDVMLLERGHSVPADGRLIAASGLTVSEAALTGEALPVDKSADGLLMPDAPLGDRRNMVFRGTIVTGGSASALVVGTGLATEVGRIHRLVAESRPPQTPMQRNLGVLGRQLVLLTGVASLLLLAAGLLRGTPLVALVRSALSMAVAAAPEGLPMIATTLLAFGVERMRPRGMLVRRIEAIETLASVSVVCLDKTGTLTRNEMSVAQLAAGGRRHHTREAGEALAPAFSKLLEIGCLCSDVELHGTGVGGEDPGGTATEVAFVRHAVACGVDPRAVRARAPLVGVRRRSEELRLMATFHEPPEGGIHVAVKGDPQDVLERCTRVMRADGTVSAMSREDRAAAREATQEVSSRGLRVLGFAFHASPAGDEAPASAEGAEPRDLVWVGLGALADPVREEAAEVVARLEAAGVRPVMITGDSPATARAVAGEIGLGAGRALRLVAADELIRLAPGDRARVAGDADVFARVSPAQKLEIVRSLQAAGRVVAMMGDGVNDSPALRAADVGIAMGRNGDTAAREVADVFLERDDLRLLVEGIAEGRATQAAVRRSVRFLIGSNASEVALMVAAHAGGLGEALTPVQLLWLNIATDVFPGIGLALEPADPAHMHRPPEPPRTPIVGRGDMRRLARDAGFLTVPALGAGAVGALLHGVGSPQARTMMFGSIVGGQLLYAYACRSRSRPPEAGRNSTLGLVVAGSLAVQGSAFVLPSLRGVLGLAPLGPLSVAVMCAGAVAPYVLKRGAADGESENPRLRFVRPAAADGTAAGSGEAPLPDAVP